MSDPAEQSTPSIKPVPAGGGDSDSILLGSNPVVNDSDKGENLKVANPAPEPVPMVQMPRYKCHKEVFALKIKAIESDWDRKKREGNLSEAQSDYWIIPEDERFAAIRVSCDFEHKHNPQAGGYYVVYADGYKSYSPAKAFEEGYTKI